MSVIPRKPARPPAMGPHDPRYYDARDLEAELHRAFQICHECRMCVGYCGSFPEMFNRIDEAIDSGQAVGAEKIDDADIKAVSEACWQCKMCYIKCPYTPDEGASEMLDIPRLLAREKANRAARDGIAFVDRVLGEPQALGQAGSGIAAPMANFVLANRLTRKVQEKVTGISAEFPLPPMAREPFSRWLAEHKPAEGASTHGEVVIFATCYGEYNMPSSVRAAVLVLEHNGYRVRYPGVGEDGRELLTCCGMPNLDGGDVKGATDKIRKNVELLLPHVRAGRKVVVPGPTCGYTMKKEWTEYLPTAEAKEVASATVDLMEFLVLLGREKKLKREFKNKLGTVAYHAACHLRAQKIGFPGARVLGIVPDTDVRVVEQCSAVDGTWGMKAANYETGRRYAGKLVRGVADLEPDLVVSDCTLAGLRVVKENGLHVMHPVEALARAYGLIPASAAEGSQVAE
ncbi:heterodisulfide reductase-related iron-sulfur binding cluster [Polyangium aurulentum]|uniref:heterodisulfide reductase-related iron-sulfur binding cluster n=1 Tax=Polyangium aurulentum TaxID=2567896 RepID=UPI0010AE42FC|nr:heterodisulfide reductase-related iron-sulfur binding cluster [Polyangium aurulentum]UQA55196.1 4Fe-4S dicluster domain-containing protein [Polyangium aurulentum]